MMSFTSTRPPGSSRTAAGNPSTGEDVADGAFIRWAAGVCAASAGATTDAAASNESLRIYREMSEVKSWITESWITACPNG